MRIGKFVIGGLAALLCATAASAAPKFDAGVIADVAKVFKADGLQATVTKGEPDYIAAVTPDGVKFITELYQCDGGRCQLAIYSANWTVPGITLDDINGWNRWTFMCPAYMSADNKPTVFMGVQTAVSDDPQAVELEVKRWMGCMDNFQSFLRDPKAFLKGK